MPTKGQNLLGNASTEMQPPAQTSGTSEETPGPEKDEKERRSGSRRRRALLRTRKSISYFQGKGKIK